MDKTNTSLNRRTTRYVSGGDTETADRFMEWWERRNYQLDETDTTYVVEKRFVGRLDLISAVFLKEPRHWWVIAMYNNILDPYSEIYEGVILYIPSIERLSDLLDGKIGGVASTREVPRTILPIV